jgi:hypothetical protein
VDGGGHLFGVDDKLLLVGTGHFHLNELRFVQLGFLAEVKGRVHLSAQITPETRNVVNDHVNQYLSNLSNILGFGVSEDVRLEVGGLCKLFIASIERTDVRPVSCVDTDMCPEVKV